MQYHLTTDTLKTGIGGVLFQLLDTPPGVIANVRNKKNMRIFIFMSWRLEPAARRYTNTEREALAIERFLGEVKWLVHGTPYLIMVYTDYSALTTLLKPDDAYGRLGNWQLKLSEYDIQYVYIPGCQNPVADGLSRMLSRFFGGQGDQNKEEVGIARDQGDGLGDGVDREEEAGKLIRTGGNGREQGEREIGNQEEGEQEVNVMESVDGWEKWMQSEWYKWIVLFLLRGSLEGEGLTARGRRRIREQSRRYRLHWGQVKGLFYMERGGKMSRCAVEEEVEGILETHHDEHGHFAGRMVALYLFGKAYWPMGSWDANSYARSCF